MKTQVRVHQRLAFLLPLVLILVAAPAQAQSFGGSLAVAEDAIMISETANRITPGIVYVFDNAGESGMWKEAMQLKATNASGEADGFGQALAADGMTLLVGANGAAYIYEPDATGAWIEKARLTTSDLGEDDAFGSQVALHGNVALVGAPAQNERTGAVYVFNRAGDTWTEAGKLAPEDLQEKDMFGATLTLDGDVALIGAPAQSQSTGAVYVFRRSGDTWAQATKLAPEQLEEGGGFGSALALHDGMALVSAPRSGTGGVYTFAHDAEADAWNQSSQLLPFAATGSGRGGRFGPRFGSALAFDGTEAWVGMPGDDRGLGGAYVFTYDAATGSWTGAVKRTSNELSGRASLGGSIAVLGDLAVVGATGIDSGAGAAVIFEREADGWQARNMVINEPHGFASVTGGSVPCAEDRAAGFECNQVDMQSFLNIQDLGGKRGVRVNDIWGWADPDTGREYAIIGRTDGTSFVDVTDAFNPVYLGDLPMTEGSSASIWRDMKVYKDHVFIVADASGQHGVQVFDLTRLRNLQNAPVTFDEDAHYTNIASAHNIVINEDTGFAYVVGASSGGESCGGGLHMVNIQDPKNPTFAGCFADPSTGRRGTGYSHDAQCVIYHGPDAEHQGQEICFGANETALSIADVTDKESPKPLSVADYPNVAYTHQGWLTEDHRYFYLNDEGDEPQGLVEGTRTLVWDVSDLDDPILVKEHIAETTSTDHNLYVKGNLMYQSNYTSGFRLLDVSDPANPVEVGYFDTVPYEGGGGSWSNYPYFESGTIIVTSMNEGLFVLKKKDVDL